MTDRFDEMTKAIYSECFKHYGDTGICSDCVAAALRKVHAEAIASVNALEAEMAAMHLARLRAEMAKERKP